MAEIQVNKVILLQKHEAEFLLRFPCCIICNNLPIKNIIFHYSLVFIQILYFVSYHLIWIKFKMAENENHQVCKTNVSVELMNSEFPHPAPLVFYFATWHSRPGKCHGECYPNLSTSTENLKVKCMKLLFIDYNTCRMKNKW